MLSTSGKPAQMHNLSAAEGHFIPASTAHAFACEGLAAVPFVTQYQHWYLQVLSHRQQYVSIINNWVYYDPIISVFELFECFESLGRKMTSWTWCFAIKVPKVRMIQTRLLCSHAPCIAHPLQLKSTLPLSQLSLQRKENQSVGATAPSPIRCVLICEHGYLEYHVYIKG